MNAPLVLFTAPFFTENGRRFIYMLSSLPGVRIGLISQDPLELLPQSISSRLAGHWRVDNIFDSNQLLWAARSLEKQLGGPVHRIFAAMEQVQLAVAEVREAMGIAGMSLETMRNFRDKGRMKVRFQEAGIPCARHCVAGNMAQALAFAGEVGFPLVVKPPEGAGSQATYKVENQEEFLKLLHNPSLGLQGEILLEEFITGEECSFDTFSLMGRPVFHSLTHYYPNPLEVVRNPWIQWQVVLPREVDDSAYDDIRQAAFRALEALGMQTGMSHLEWFRRRDGSIAISEVAARPPGAQITTLITRSADWDAVEAWARLMIFGECRPPERKYAVGAAYLRGQGEGRVVAVEGLDQIRQEFGHLITDLKVPEPGQAAATSYEGEGYLILRHPETQVVKEALDKVVSSVRVQLA